VAISIPREKQQQVIASIRRYFSENLDDEIGELKAGLVLDYFLREIGPTIYNQAIIDAQAFFQEKVADLDGSCYEPEFDYWSVE
jgi:uncharacterized protein (DUF2164 family)